MEEEKFCQTCCEVLKRKEKEKKKTWEKRTHCNKSCASNDPRKKGKKGTKFLIPKRDFGRSFER